MHGPLKNIANEFGVRHALSLYGSGHSRLGGDIRIGIHLENIDVPLLVYAKIDPGVVPALEESEGLAGNLFKPASYLPRQESWTDRI